MRSTWLILLTYSQTKCWKLLKIKWENKLDKKKVIQFETKIFMADLQQ